MDNGHATNLQAIDVVPYERTIPYPNVPNVRLPQKPEVEIRGGGLFGWGLNGQDLAHQRRMTELYHLGTETALAEEMAIGVEVCGIKEATEGVRKAEQIVYAQPQDTVAGMVASDLAGDMAARTRVRHGRLAESYDAEAMNIIHRR